MKLLLCQECYDIVAPNPTNLLCRTCICQRHTVWWVDGAKGILKVCDCHQENNAAYVLGINNQFLRYPGEITAHVVKQIDDACPDTYIFKRIHSPLIRIRPGQSNDTSWATREELLEVCKK